MGTVISDPYQLLFQLVVYIIVIYIIMFIKN